MAQLILVLNPGSTSTKAAVYEDERPLLSCSIAHTNQDLAPYPTLYDQLDYRVSLVRSWLAREGFDPKYGARPLRRAIQSKVEDAVAEKLLEGTLKEGDTAKLTVEDDKLVVTK